MSDGIYNKMTGYHNRRSLRLQGYDYSRSGWYFVTICIHEWRQELFGVIRDGSVVLNELGKCVQTCWLAIQQHFPSVKLDDYVIMPNHMHGIIIITNSGPNDNAVSIPAVGAGLSHHMKSRQYATAASGLSSVISPVSYELSNPGLGSIIAWFSYESTKRMNVIRTTGMLKIWQRNYYDHIIRDEKSLLSIRRYIRNNPVN